MDIIEFFYIAYEDIIKQGYADEVEYVDNIKPIDAQTPENFYLEYVWVVLNAGMKEQVARKIYNNYCDKFDIKYINHPTKKIAISEMFLVYPDKFKLLSESSNKIKYLESLSWIGPITKHHLARNIGIDTVKPDRHLVKLSEIFGFNNPLEMCECVNKDNGEKVGIIDVILWRYCNLNIHYEQIIQNAVRSDMAKPARTEQVTIDTI